MTGEFLKGEAGFLGTEQVTEPRASDPGNRDGVGQAIAMLISIASRDLLLQGRRPVARITPGASIP